MGGASMTSLACSPLTSLISLALEFFYVMNMRAEVQLLCLEIGDGSRRQNKFGIKDGQIWSHICPLAYNYRNMDCSARLVLSLLAGPNNGQSRDKSCYTPVGFWSSQIFFGNPVH
jgi:hypothetical protein